jgi:hypothetical protein
MINLQQDLPANTKIQACIFCKHSHYNVAGNDNFGDLNCFKHCQPKNKKVNTKNDVIDLFEAEYKNSRKVEETFWCPEFEIIEADNFVFKNQVKEN